MSRKAAKYSGLKVGAKVAVIAARFNQGIVDELLKRCEKRLGELGVREVEIFRVPGAFELPVAAKAAAKSGRFGAVICLGAVIRGETPHFDFVAGEAARGIQEVGLETGVPVIFGVLTTDNEKQARDRLDVGTRAAEGAVEMIGVVGDISHRGARGER